MVNTGRREAIFIIYTAGLSGTNLTLLWLFENREQQAGW